MSSLVYGIHAVDNLVQSNQAIEIIVFKKQNTNPKISNIIEIAEAKNIKVTFIDSFKQLPARVKKDANHQNIFAIEKDTLQTYTEKDIEKFIADGYRSHPKVRLAMTAGMEHITAIMSEFILNNPEVLEPLQETMRELIYWHAVEEIEHKAVAFDVYQQCVGNEDLRRRTLRIATLMFSLRITAYTIALLWWSKSLPSFKDIRGAFSFMFGKKGMIRNIRKPYMAYFKEGFHPWDSDNRDLIEKWKNNFYDAKHDRGSDEFDTSALDKGMDNGIAAA